MALYRVMLNCVLLHNRCQFLSCTTCDCCEYQVYAYFLFIWQFVIPLILFCFAYWKIFGVVRRQATVATNRRKITAASKEPVAGTSTENVEPVANIGLTSDKSRRDLGVKKKVMPVASTSQQAGDQKQGLSKAKMNVLRTMIYIFVCFVICWMPFNIVILYYRITVSSTS